MSCEKEGMGKREAGKKKSCSGGKNEGRRDWYKWWSLGERVGWWRMKGWQGGSEAGMERRVKKSLEERCSG